MASIVTTLDLDFMNCLISGYPRDVTHLEGVQTTSHVTACQLHERREHSGVGAELLPVADLAQAGDDELGGRLAESDNARERSQRSECRGVEVVANADNRTSQRLRRLVPLLLRGDVLDELDQTSDKALDGQRTRSPCGLQRTVSPPPLAPSISSMTTAVGRPSEPSPVPVSIAFLMRVETVAAERSSEALISSVRYPACLATTWASVVLP